ncbi:MAG: hypothetical protein IPG99_03170 [Ignavibacteria bacterium]|nr:hypothetical protein [Ignavibacteria bacterium]
MKVAVAQIECVLGDISRNIEKHIHYCEEAIKNKGRDNSIPGVVSYRIFAEGY